MHVNGKCIRLMSGEETVQENSFFQVKSLEKLSHKDVAKLFLDNSLFQPPKLQLDLLEFIYS